MAALDRHEALVSWVTSEGGYCHEHIKVAHDNERGFHLQVKPNTSIPAGSSLLRCPMKCVLTVLNALDSSPFSSHGSSFPNKFLDTQSPQLIQYFFLMEQRVLGDQSWWAPYIATLQTPEELPNFVPFDEEDLQWIDGTNLQAGLKAQFTRWRELYDQGLRILKELEWPNAVQGLYTWKLFVWAAKQFDSRSFTPALLADTLPAEKATGMGKGLPDHGLLSRTFQEGFSVLIPLLDLTSHQPSYEVDWKHNMNDIGIDCRQHLEGPVEVRNNYGPKYNETLLLAYGFTIQDNPFDVVLINLKAPPGSPLEQARKIWREQRHGREEADKLYIMNSSHPNSKSAKNRQEAVFTSSLLASVSTLVANDRELKSTLFQRQQTAYPPMDNPYDWQRNLVGTYAQLAIECKARLELLAARDPRRENRALEPSNSAQAYAKIYRDSQQSILECAYHVCCYELLRARSPGPISPTQRLERRMKVYGASEQTQQKVLGLIDRKSNSFVLEGVMFASEEALAVLDETTKEGLEEALQEIITGNTDPIPTLLLSKIQFTIFLAFIDLQNGQNPSSLPSRLKSWLTHLDEWYPITQPTDLTLPTEELLPLLESLLNVLPDDAWSQELICWAWNVVQEEHVNLPMRESGNVLGGGGSTDFVVAPTSLEMFLYVPVEADQQ